jgi:hypothetical protein
MSTRIRAFFAVLAASFFMSATLPILLPGAEATPVLWANSQSGSESEGSVYYVFTGESLELNTYNSV